MQRETDDGIIIACDFCGTEWDQVKPMIEGHRGSVICLPCVKSSITTNAESAEEFVCTLCLSAQPGGTTVWRPHPVAEKANPEAVVCESCIQQASEAFGKERNVDFEHEES